MLVTALLPMRRFCPNSLPAAAGILALLPLLYSFACGNRNEDEHTRGESIRADRIAAHTRFLSSDALEGRGIGGRAETVTTEYIAAQFELAGAIPAGDSGTFFQSVPLMGVKTQPDASLSWSSRGARNQLKYLDQFVVVNHRQEPLVELETEAVYVGHGIVAPEFDWDDYKGVDVKGKVVILFTNEPDSDAADFFGGPALTYYGRWTFKYEEALRQGAAGCLIIHTTPTAGYPWEVVRNSWSGREPFVKLAPGEDALALAGWLHADAAKSLLAATGKSLDELRAMCESRDFQPIPLSIRVQARLTSDVEPINTRNVVGMIEGSDDRNQDQAVIYTAHWDHLGVGVAVDGDGIYNGAVDNATGLALLLELAREFGEQTQRPQRSILFAAVGAEEGGLRGSEYYAHHPFIPAAKTAVNINFDGLAPLGRTNDITLPGFERTTLRPIVEALAKESGFTIRPEAHPEQGYYYRSDHFSMAKVGVPAFSLKLGIEYVGKPAGWGLAAQEDYTANRYHRPSDEFDPSWDFSGLEQLVRFGFELGLRVANEPELPTWNEGDEFLPARLKSWAR
jgi:Zn-dependent M28 family amino/carboxypeptidase